MIVRGEGRGGGVSKVYLMMGIVLKGCLVMDYDFKFDLK